MSAPLTIPPPCVQQGMADGTTIPRDLTLEEKIALVYELEDLETALELADEDWRFEAVERRVREIKALLGEVER